MKPDEAASIAWREKILKSVNALMQAPPNDITDMIVEAFGAVAYEARESGRIIRERDERKIRLAIPYGAGFAVDVDKDRCSGEPVLGGTRFPVSTVFAELEDGKSIADIADEYELSCDTLRQLLATVAAAFSNMPVLTIRDRRLEASEAGVGLMGYMRHHAIVVTSWNEDRLKSAHMEAKRLGVAVSNVVESAVNGYRSFCVFPDGSKLDWPEDEGGDHQRVKLVNYLDAQRCEDGSSPFAWVEIQYGDDAGVTYVVKHSDEPLRRRAGVIE